MTRPFAAAMLLTAALCWGAGNVANKTVLEHLSPMMAVGLRCTLGALAIAPFALRDVLRKGDPGWWRSAISVAVLFAAALVLQQMAYQSTTVTNASFLVNTATPRPCASRSVLCITWGCWHKREKRRSF